MHWQQRIGKQRDWVWRGWQTRYTFKQPPLKGSTPLILLHGFGASIEQWRNNLSILGQSHAVYALDLLGFGASRKAPVDYSVDLWVEQVHDFWRTFIGEPVVLVGNSIGSLVCMVIAARYPEMAKGIAMSSLPDVAGQRETMPRWLQSLEATLKGIVASPFLLKILFKVVRRRGVIRRWAGLAYASQASITDELVEILAAPPQDEGAARVFCSLFLAINRPQFAPAAKAILPNLAIPILLIWGRQDRMVPSRLAQPLAALNPQIELVEIDNAGHCPHDECPDQFNSLLLDWLESKWKSSAVQQFSPESTLPSPKLL